MESLINIIIVNNFSKIMQVVDFTFNDTAFGRDMYLACCTVKT